MNIFTRWHLWANGYCTKHFMLKDVFEYDTAPKCSQCMTDRRIGEEIYRTALAEKVKRLRQKAEKNG